jgi:hypothetical protein
MKRLVIGLLATTALFAQAQAATPWWTKMAQAGVPAVFVAADPPGWTKYTQTAEWPVTRLAATNCARPL